MGFHDNLVKIRELLGFKPAEVIEKTGIAKQKYYGYEKGTFAPSPEIVDQLAKFFKIPREIFYKVKVSAEDVHGSTKGNFRDEIFEGDYIGLHKRVWNQIELGMIHDREIMKTLANSLAEAVKQLSHNHQ